MFLHTAPIFHIIDLPFLFSAPAFGVGQAAIPKFSALEFCEVAQRERVSHTVLAPTMINWLTQLPNLEEYDLSSLEQVAYGGSPMAPEVIERVRAALPQVKLIQGYGLTETGFLTGLQDHEHVPGRLTSCGRSCPGVDLRILDDGGHELGVGQQGELVVRGANVMQRYWNNPHDTAQVLCDGFFRTGDIGYRDADGYFFILDRLKDMIVSGGENVYSGEVEAVIQAHPAVLETAVFGIPDAQWGELVMACVVRKPGWALDAGDLIAYCRHSLAHYKAPRRVKFLETELPKSGAGKILKRVLREPYWVRAERAVA
jgi:long-chain acyl-CoA synthetase